MFSFRFVLLLILPLFAVTVHSATIADVSKSNKWNKLLHLSDEKSKAQGLGFFLYKIEDWTPERELEATINAIDEQREIGHLKLKAHCAFPTRAKFLKEKGLIGNLPPCPRVENWIKGMSPKSISLIFASAYANNPSSIFGHTFLRVNSSKKEGMDNKALDLLDYGLNYAAEIGDDGPMSFIYKGVFGLYQGHFSVAPYYQKVNEYNNFENRDLWEYRLHLSTEEVVELIEHIWEIEYNTYFDYYFFNENCSFMILKLLEIVRPEINFRDRLKFYISPLETVKEVKKAGLIESAEYRPAIRSKFNHRLKKLTSKEKDKLNQIIDTPSQASTEILDTALLYYKLKKHIDRGLDKEGTENFASLLVLRSKDKTPPSKIKIKKIDPTMGHDSMGIQIGYLKNGTDKVFLNYSPGVHSITDSSAGYIKNTSLNFLELMGSFSETDNKFYLERFTPFEVESYSPFSKLSPSPSYHLSSNFLNNFKDSFHRFGMGVSTEFFETLSIYLMPTIYLLDSRNVEYGAIGEIGVLMDLRRVKLKLYYSPRTDRIDFRGNEYGGLGSIVISKDYSLQMGYHYFDETHQYQFGIKGHF